MTYRWCRRTPSFCQTLVVSKERILAPHWLHAQGVHVKHKCTWDGRRRKWMRKHHEVHRRFSFPTEPIHLVASFKIKHVWCLPGVCLFSGMFAHFVWYFPLRETPLDRAALSSPGKTVTSVARRHQTLRGCWLTDKTYFLLLPPLSSLFLCKQLSSYSKEATTPPDHCEGKWAAGSVQVGGAWSL